MANGETMFELKSREYASMKITEVLTFAFFVFIHSFRFKIKTSFYFHTFCFYRSVTQPPLQPHHQTRPGISHMYSIFQLVENAEKSVQCGGGWRWTWKIYMSKTWVKIAKYKNGNVNVHILCIIFVNLADIIVRLHMESNFTGKEVKTHVAIHTQQLYRCTEDWGQMRMLFGKRTQRKRGSCQRQHRPTQRFEWKRKNKGILEECTVHFPTWRPAWYDDDVNVDGMRVETV